MTKRVARIVVLIAAALVMSGCFIKCSSSGNPNSPSPTPNPNPTPGWDGAPIVPYTGQTVHFESPDGKVVLDVQQVSPAVGQSLQAGKEFGVWLVGSYRNSEGKPLKVKAFKTSSVGGLDEPSPTFDKEGARGWSQEGENKGLLMAFKAEVGENIPVMRLKACYSVGVCDFQDPKNIAWIFDVQVDWR